METFIPVYCRTNLDGFDCTKIKKMATRPIKGDRVEVEKLGMPRLLYVVGITHRIKPDGTAYLEVELNNM